MEMGLGNIPPQPQGQPQQPQMQGQPQGGTPPVRRASQDEQRLYNRFVGLSMTLLYDQKFMQRAIEMMRARQTTAEGVADVSSLIAFQVYTQGKKQGQEIPASVVLHAGMEVITLVIEMALAAGFPPMSDQEMQQAFYNAADAFREKMEQAGHIDPEQMQQDAQQIEAMAQDGRFAQTMAAIQAEQSKMVPEGGPVANPQQQAPMPQGGM